MADLDHPDDSPRHGGDLAFATARYGAPAEGWLDLSTGINPRPWPAPPLPPDALARLPDPASLAHLLTTARRNYGVPEAAAIAATPGTEIAIQLLPLVAPPGPVAIVAPTYASHAAAWHGANRAVTFVVSVDALAADAALVVLANPNNPDGRTTDPATLAALACRLSERGGILVVDEAFADVAPAASLAPHLAGLPAIVLRSLGKFYGLAGLRLGIAAGTPATVARLAALLGDWPVSGPAIAIGGAALADTAWRDATRVTLADLSRRLGDTLARHQFAVAGATDLFALIDDGRAPQLHAHLASRGIWTRAFAYQPRWLRFGLPGDDAAFARLERALSAFR